MFIGISSEVPFMKRQTFTCLFAWFSLCKVCYMSYSQMMFIQRCLLFETYHMPLEESTFCSLIFGETIVYSHQSLICGANIRQYDSQREQRYEILEIVV